MNPQLVEYFKNVNPDRAAKMEITLNWAAENMDRFTFDRFTKDGKGGRVRWMRKPSGYPKQGLPWHSVRGRYVYPEGK